ncbi:hypothetical protein ACWDKQ_21375 [Saccharopolyspora sp. NPDC000995]
MSQPSLPRRRLGRSGPLASAVGYGAIGLSGVYGAADDAESARLLDQLLDLGSTSCTPPTSTATGTTRS